MGVGWDNTANESPQLSSQLGASAPDQHRVSGQTGEATDQLVARRSIASWIYLGLNLPLVVAIFALPHLHLYLWGLLGMGSVAAIVVGVLRNRPTHPMAWLLLALGVTTFATGDITYDVLTKFLHEQNPFPSLADIFYLATYLLLAAGLITMVRMRRRRDGETGALLDALIITLGLGVVSWIYLIQPYVHATDMTLFAKLTSIAYPLGDILLLCVLARLVFGGGTPNTSVRLLTMGAVGVLVADSAYGWIQLNGSWKVGGPTDLGWVLFYLCWGAAALHPTMRELTMEQPWHTRQLNPATLVVLTASALVAPLIIVWRDVRGLPKDAGVLATFSVLVFTLVMLRLNGLVRAQAINTRREQALRTFSESLVATTERSDVWTAAVNAVEEIGASGVIGCIVTESSVGGERVLAATWPDLAGVVVHVTVPRPKGGRRVVCLANGRPVTASPLATMWTELDSAQLDAGQERMLLAHDRPLPIDLRAILDSIAAQLTLALGRVELAPRGPRREKRAQIPVHGQVLHGLDQFDQSRPAHHLPDPGRHQGPRPRAGRIRGEDSE